MQWTEEQQKVIELRERNILVSAAAGSGKTAVLVERIIRMLTDRDKPVDVDRLLIVTFTEAAAAEMKERIRAAIEDALERRPGDVHLQRQSTLIHNAPITTIHSFCLSVIREHFHVLDLDPGFRIAEEGELKLLRQDVLDELLEECYREGEPVFLAFVEKFGRGRNDKKIEELILSLYDYSRSYPQPEKWLEACGEAYYIDPGNPEESECASRVKELARLKMEDILAVLEEGAGICELSDGPYMYADMLASDKEAVMAALKAESFDDIYQSVRQITWKRLSAKKDESVDPEKKEQVKGLREKAKKMLKDTIAACFFEEPEEMWKDMNDSRETIEALTGLVGKFSRLFSEKKQDRNMIDFGDMEQFALKILTHEEEGRLVPSIVAAEYQEQFVEVMIDEYQDSNLIQEAILTSVSTVSRDRNNIFMVGDVKQSIYRFRLSRPELFMEKYDSYSQEDSKTQRIDLHKNFRSRTEVLESINFIFEHIMQKPLGGICYDEQAALYPGAAYEPQTDARGKSFNFTELLLVDTSENVGEEEEGTQIGKPWEGTDREQEAQAVAWRIKELMRTGKVVDKATGSCRTPRYSDIVILTRSVKGWADVFAEVLAEEGIPAYTGSKEGYFETYEISILLDYLKILDNFRQELPLAAVLASPLAGLNAGQMANIRNAFPGLPFFEAVVQYSEGVDLEGETKDLLIKFLGTYRQYRRKVPYTAIHELLWDIIENTGYGVYMYSMPGGTQRMANLEMLVEKASAFESTSYKGLFNFVRYIEQLQKYDVDYGEADVEDGQSDTVRIMTIHKSKGLEFPIVFVAGMGKKFNMQDTAGSIVIHPDWGIGIDAVDLERRTKIPTILKKVIQEEMIRENLGEELRVLYVALTRAKEKLIMTAVLPGAGEAAEQIKSMVQGRGKAGRICTSKSMPLPMYVLSGARRYLDWIMPLLPGLSGSVPMEFFVVGRREASEYAEIERRGESLARDVLEHWDTGQVYHEALRDRLAGQLEYSYPYMQEGRLKLKFTVSELKKRAYLQDDDSEELYAEPEVVPLIPSFIKEENKLTGASRGSAYHKLLEILDFSKKYDEASLIQEINQFLQEGKLSADMAECIQARDILKFLHSPSGTRMHLAAVKGLLGKEQPFVLGVDAKEIYVEENLNEMILVQGIIDAYFEEDGELTVLDYKTDKVRFASELKEKYHAQLDYYAQAMEQLTGKKVKEKIIYSFTLEEEIYV